jgi:hypothetical protein
MGVLSSIWKAQGAVGKVATIAGALFVPFFLMAAGNYVAAHGVASTAAGIWTSFWGGLVTNPVTAQMGIGPGLENMWNGAKYLCKAFGHAAGAAMDPATNMLDAINSPVPDLLPV